MPEAPRVRAWWVLALFTAIQIGIGIWRAGVMLRDGLASGVRPLGWSAGLGLDLLLCGLLALAAWWWLPARGPRSAGAWGARFLLLSWSLLLAHYGWAMLNGGSLEPALTWLLLAAMLAVGTWVRRRDAGAPPVPAADAGGAGGRPALWIAAAFFAAQLPHLVVPYTFTDARLIWACRALRIAEQGSLTGLLDCIDPARAPLHAILLWLGIADPTFEGRLLPLLMFGAFALLFYQLLRRVAPRLAPWGLVWLLVTDQVMKGQISSYSGVPAMLAIVLALALLIDERAVTHSRGLAVALALAAGGAIALIRRDGMPEYLIAALGLIALTRRWRDPVAWTPVAATLLAYLTWTLRPDALESIPSFPPRLGASMGAVYQTAASSASFWEHLRTLIYGAQGQVFSHYGYGVFAWGWIIVTVWAWRRGGRRFTLEPAALYGIAGLTGWLATLAAYAALTLWGHEYMSSLAVVRTGFGRHLVHFFPLCLLHAVARAERIAPVSAEARTG